MKVLFVVRPGNHPATRLRVNQYLDYLKNNGIDSEVVPFPDGLLGWWLLLKKAAGFNVIFFQKKRVHRFWLKRLQLKGIKIIYDFDDAVMFNSSRHPKPESPLRMRHFISMVKRCDGIIAGNDYLKSFAEPHNKNIRVIPTTIDTSKYRVKTYSADIPKSLILGWIGGRKSLVFLRTLQPTLDKLAAQYKDIKLKIVCDEFLNSTGMEIIKKHWAEKEEVDDILSFDIGLAPLPDDPWSRGKCATKLLQCMAAGVPSVASNVGVHNEIIKEAVNGFLTKNDNEWFEKLKRLIEDKSLREKIGLSARETVEKYYSVQANAPKLAEVLKGVLCV